jgi:hypothetical protein
VGILYIAIAIVVVFPAMISECWKNWNHTNGRFWATVWKTAFEGIKFWGAILTAIQLIGMVILLAGGQIQRASVQAVILMFGLFDMAIFFLLGVVIACAIVFSIKWMLNGKPSFPRPPSSGSPKN